MAEHPKRGKNNIGLIRFSSMEQRVYDTNPGWLGFEGRPPKPSVFYHWGDKSSRKEEKDESVFHGFLCPRTTKDFEECFDQPEKAKNDTA